MNLNTTVSSQTGNNAGVAQVQESRPPRLPRPPMKPTNSTTLSVPGLSAPMDSFTREIRSLRRWILSAFILGFICSSMLSAYIAVGLHSELVSAIRLSVREEIEIEYEAKHFNIVFAELLSRPQTVNVMCKKWWFDMDHTQRKINP